MPSKTSVQKLTVVNEPVFVSKDGSVQEYIPKEIVGFREAYAASLHLVFKHVADFHMAMLEIVAEKYGHDVEEMVSVIQSDERFKSMTVHPVISGLGIIEQKDIPAPAEAPPAPVAVTEAPVPKKKIIVKRKQSSSAPPPPDDS